MCVASWSLLVDSVSLHDEIGRSLEFGGAGAVEYAPHYLAAAVLDPMRSVRASLAAAADFIVGFDWATALAHIQDASAVAEEFGIEEPGVRAQILIRQGTVERALANKSYVERLLDGCELAREAGDRELFVVGVTELCGHGATTGVGDADPRILALLDEALSFDIPAGARAELSAASVPLLATSSRLVAGSKESGIAATVSDPNVLITGHPFVDVWAGIRPKVLGLDDWPEIPYDPQVPWKEGMCAALGVPFDGFWPKLRNRVHTFAGTPPRTRRRSRATHRLRRRSRLTHRRERRSVSPRYRNLGRGLTLRRSCVWSASDQTKALANTRLTIVMTLIKMFIDGPEVSLNGSPTVSPTTAALCGSEPLPP